MIRSLKNPKVTHTCVVQQHLSKDIRSTSSKLSFHPEQCKIWLLIKAIRNKLKKRRDAVGFRIPLQSFSNEVTLLEPPPPFGGLPPLQPAVRRTEPAVSLPGYPAMIDRGNTAPWDSYRRDLRRRMWTDGGLHGFCIMALVPTAP